MKALYLDKKHGHSEKVEKIEKDLDALAEKVNKRLAAISDKLEEVENKKKHKKMKRNN